MGRAPYSAAKFGVEGFSEVLAGEMAPFGVHVTIIEPGGFRTDFAGASTEINDGHPDYAERPSARLLPCNGRMMAANRAIPLKQRRRSSRYRGRVRRPCGSCWDEMPLPARSTATKGASPNSGRGVQPAKGQISSGTTQAELGGSCNGQPTRGLRDNRISKGSDHLAQADCLLSSKQGPSLCPLSSDWLRRSSVQGGSIPAVAGFRTHAPSTCA